MTRGLEKVLNCAIGEVEYLQALIESKLQEGVVNSYVYSEEYRDEMYKQVKQLDKVIEFIENRITQLK